MIHYIGIGYRKQQGKDTFADMMIGYGISRGRSVTKISFADPLKKFCMEVFGLTYEQCYGTDEQKNSITKVTARDIGMPHSSISSDGAKCWSGHCLTARQVLQYFGSEVMRKHVPGIWVNAPFRKEFKDGTVVILPDCRFPDEIEAVVNHGGLTICVDGRTDAPTGDGHQSENAVKPSDFQHTILNTGTKNDLRSSAQFMFDNFVPEF